MKKYRGLVAPPATPIFSGVCSCILLVALFSPCFGYQACAQQGGFAYERGITYDLAHLFKTGRLEATSDTQFTHEIDTLGRQGITTRGILWIKDVEFSEGVVSLDLRGRNVFLKSFMGVAFHARDTKAYDVAYFCPFRFHDKPDSTRAYSVKYMSVPDWSYEKLRKTNPGEYEHEIVVDRVPQADEWFHVRIVVDKDSVAVYINSSETPSLKCKRLPSMATGKIGLWSWPAGLTSDFANLYISRFRVGN